MQCSTRPAMNLADGQLACYGVWDYGNSFGEDHDMCGGYSSDATGCLVNTPACASGKAIAAEVVTISSATSAQLSTIAANLGVTTEVLSAEMVKVYVYNCMGGTTQPPPNNRVVFAHTGANQTFTVPAGVTSLRVKLWGAGGGGGYYSAAGFGGGGAYSELTLGVTPGQVYTLVVGQGGYRGLFSSPTTGNGRTYGGGGSGGGRSAFRLGTTELATAGGGGGAGTFANGINGNGGAAGRNGQNGVNGVDPDGSFGTGGGGGTQTAGGAAGIGGCGGGVSPGSQFMGGDGYIPWGCGNGGGGGGDTNGSNGAGGGGGSSYASGGLFQDASGRAAANQTDADPDARIPRIRSRGAGVGNCPGLPDSS
ncbi:hypothetical protein F0U61_34270 [Archangium violaceum]|uniref:glycine-rich domain-containing protein n=1 Tax=Archangium violaceum TaxID=83451 RepID=UPI002B2F6E8B|nr:hypothetical protein F0U61_34270 [Archangium violaceum]